MKKGLMCTPKYFIFLLLTTERRIWPKFIGSACCITYAQHGTLTATGHLFETWTVNLVLSQLWNLNFYPTGYFYYLSRGNQRNQISAGQNCKICVFDQLLIFRLVCCMQIKESVGKSKSCISGISSLLWIFMIFYKSPEEIHWLSITTFICWTV